MKYLEFTVIEEGVTFGEPETKTASYCSQRPGGLNQRG